jgi:hypothetical protein
MGGFSPKTRARMMRLLRADTLLSSAAHAPAREAYERRAAGN